jgi:hypothetical protein
VGGLTAATSYTFTVRAKMQQEISGASNSLTVVNSNNTSTDLLFSYIEGSSNNKALEISNTGVAVNLSIYSIKKTNGAGAGAQAYLYLEP